MTRPYAYLRKSRVFRDQESVSPEMQLAAAREYAAQFGDSDLVVLTDMNLSGKKGRQGRPGFNALLTALEVGEVRAIYSYSLSRLSRSVRDLLALADLCREHGVPIRLARDTDPDPTTATGRAVLAMLGVMAQLEADLAQERALDAVEARRARGDVFGPAPFDHPETVVEAYRQAGTATGAARLLNAAQVPTRKGTTVWYPSSVTVILNRVAPEILPPVRRAGLKHGAPFVFYHLIRCHCGATLTGARHRTGPQAGYVLYRCTRGRLIPNHGKTHIPETRIEDFARREMTRLRPPTDLIALADSTEAERVAVRARIERLGVAFIAGLIPEADMLAEKAELDAALMRLDLAGQAVRIPGFEWDHGLLEVNRALRALWSHIQLDRDFRPVLVEWLVPDSWLGPATPE